MTTKEPTISTTEEPQSMDPRARFAACIDELLHAGHSKERVAQDLGDALVDLAYPEQRADLIVEIIANLAVGLRDGPYGGDQG